MDYKNFYHWLEGYLDSKLESYLDENLVKIKEKMEKVKTESKVISLGEIPLPKAPKFNVTTTNDQNILED